jgi:hypothetical protein
MIQIVCPLKTFWENASKILRHPAIKDMSENKNDSAKRMSAATAS